MGMQVNRVLFLVGAAVLALVGVTQAQASSLAPDLSHMHDRTDTMVRHADFDGDGTLDEIYFSAGDNVNRVDVRVRLNTASGPKDIDVTSIDARDASAMAVQVVPAGRYHADCGNFAAECDEAPVVASHDSLIFAMSGGTNVLAHWQDDHFEQDFVRSDEALMAHVLSTLYALNP